MTQRISKVEASALAVIAQGLDEPVDGCATKEQLLETIRRIGCLQIDTISVVARSHYVVLWSRVGQYAQEWLDELHHPDRKLFEYWGHAASLLPAELYPYFRRRMMKRHAEHFEREGSWSFDNRMLIDEVFATVRDHGPLSSSFFERPDSEEKVEAWSWWGGKPANRALDVLWSTGKLAVDRRVSFQRHYDLAERIFPEHFERNLPDEDEEKRLLAKHAIRAMGIGFPRDVNDYFRTKWGGRTRAILSELEQTGEVFCVDVDGLGTAYVAESSRPLLNQVIGGRRPTRTTFLSPFDNLIWERRRTEKLFDFDYRIECYTPAAKRKYGYFTLPILDQGRLIGRLDPKVDRREKVLYLRAIHMEPDVQLDDPLARRLHHTIRQFARFNNASTVVVQSGPPEIERQFDV